MCQGSSTVKLSCCVPKADLPAASSARTRMSRLPIQARVLDEVSMWGQTTPPACGGQQPHPGLLNYRVLFCTAACKGNNGSFTIGSHPDVGEGAKPATGSDR